MATPHPPGADYLPQSVHAKPHNRPGVDAGDPRRLLRNEFVDHLRRAHLGYRDREIPKRRLLFDEVA